MLSLRDALTLATLSFACVSDDNSPSIAKGDAGTPDSAAPGSGIYVAEDGKDTNPGTRELPLRTIAAAVGLAPTKGLSNAEVFVCKGVYPEKDLRITTPLTLRGGYACATWQRAPGFPNAKEVDPNESRIENGAPDQSDMTLRIQSAKGVVLEGVTIVAAGGEKTTFALRIEDSADITVRNNVLAGGTTNVATLGQPGGYVVSVKNAPTTLESNLLRGGFGTSLMGLGTFLLRLEGSGGSKVLKNAFLSNKSTGLSALTFISVTDAAPSPEPVQVFDNTLSVRGATATGSATVALRLVHGFGTAVAEVSRNVFNVVDLLCEQTCSVFGLQAGEASVVTSRHNFVDLRGARVAASKALTARGVFLNETGTMNAEGNVFLLPEAPIGSTSALYTDCGAMPNCAKPGPKAIFRHNTAYLAPGLGSSPFWLEGQNAVVEDNLFVASKEGQSITGWLRELSGGSLQSFAGNAFVGPSSFRFDANGASPLALADLPVFEGRVGMAGSNVREVSAASVVAEPDPAKWPPVAVSLPAPFGAFDLVPSVRCSIASSPRPVSTMVDYLNRPWRAMPSVGAYQWQGATCTQ